MRRVARCSSCGSLSHYAKTCARVDDATPREVVRDYLTHAEIGERLGMTGARVRQIEARAIEKLRIAMADSPLLGEQFPRGLR